MHTIIPTIPAIDLDDEPMVLIPCEKNHFADQLILYDILTEAGLGDECILSIQDLDGTLTHYAYAMPLSLAQQAARRMRGNPS